MATSDSDTDFESADEEVSPTKRYPRQAARRTTVDSESDDDTEYVQQESRESSYWWSSNYVPRDMMDALRAGQKFWNDNCDKIDNVKVESDTHTAKTVDCLEKTGDKQETSIADELKESMQYIPTTTKFANQLRAVQRGNNIVTSDAMSKVEASKTAPVDEKSSQAKLQQDTSHQLSAKKLGTRLAKGNIDAHCTNVAAEQEDECSAKCLDEKTQQSTIKDETYVEDILKAEGAGNNKFNPLNDLSEVDMPEELKSNKKFKEVFQPEGWEELTDNIKFPDDLMEKKLEPLLQRISLANKEERTDDLEKWNKWGDWGNWGMHMIINTASTSMSTLSSHVSQGLTLLEGTIGAQNPTEPERIDQDADTATNAAQSENQEQENQTYSSFGFGNLITGVSSITKLVESTGSKVMTGGLDTLEAIGKKTMEVLQEGDPGLKKKRAFFLNESEKPNLSQILREAKEKAETEEKTIEERELARKVHFESLFDDYQGLVHLEALEMLSKQSNMKIQQYLLELNMNDLASVQETLEEIKELCDLGDEDDEDKDNKDLKNRLENSCSELGIDITYEKLYNVWTETENYLASEHKDQEIFQTAISTLAQFTAFSVERFHKTAELLLIKERRSTVNEADALVQLTNILSDHISLLANSFCSTLNQLAESAKKSDNINTNITTIFFEAANANSYIQDAFRLLIPILQVGAI